jgi:hypothetical protein
MDFLAQDERKRPVGQITSLAPNPVQPLREKYSTSLFTQITGVFKTVSSLRGAARDRHETRDGMRWTRMRF